MAQGNNSIKKVLIVAFSLCIVCSVIVSTAAVALRPAQQLNQAIRLHLTCSADAVGPH